MRRIALPLIGTWGAWRSAARREALAGTPPEALAWTRGTADDELPFAAADTPVPRASLTVPKRFLELAEAAVCHPAPDRFARLYALLVRLQAEPGVLGDRTDPAVGRLVAMEKEVARASHKMKAFVRFRDVAQNETGRRRFAAWFEPAAHVTERTAPFFARRFGDMDWAIATPEITARFTDGALSFEETAEVPPAGEDATEALWLTYFASIFNPARLKTQAMQSEMPKMYWKNLPEARLIPGLIAGAEKEVAAMHARAASQPPPFAARILARSPETPPMPDAEPNTLAEARAAAAVCTRCPLYECATRTVFGEGPETARMMAVGEQPGDQEDLAGRPFVGPAGQVFDRAAQAAGLKREEVYVTNAVKHFKFTPRGKRRIHQKPDHDEIARCSWWLGLETRFVAPKLILALGATAAHALTGSGVGIMKRRGTVEATAEGVPVFLTTHPSMILRIPDRAAQADAEAAFTADLGRAWEVLADL